VLVGEGKSLRGELRLRNPGSEVLQVREANLRVALAGSDRPQAFASLALSASLQPGQSQRIKISLELDARIPPGEYTGAVEVGGQTRAVMIYVAEVVKLSLSPQTVVIDQPGGASAVKRVILSNEGNVPLTIGPFGRVAVAEELLLRRSVSATLAAGEKESRSAGKIFADLVTQEAKALGGAVIHLEVASREPGLVLQPGDVRALDLDIHLPGNLHPGSRYIGRVALYTSDLEFVVVPLPGDLSRKPGAAASDDVYK